MPNAQHSTVPYSTVQLPGQLLGGKRVHAAVHAGQCRVQVQGAQCMVQGKGRAVQRGAVQCSTRQGTLNALNAHKIQIKYSTAQIHNAKCKTKQAKFTTLYSALQRSPLFYSVFMFCTVNLVENCPPCVDTVHLVQTQSTLRGPSPPCVVLRLVETLSTALLSLNVLHYPYSTFLCTAPILSIMMPCKSAKLGGKT